jgi:HD-GYP domain-containing protein (c-di-GMP phosphodiesterase class II)
MKRPYRDALSPEKAFAVMRDEVRRAWWDGALVDEFEGVVLASAPFERARFDM